MHCQRVKINMFIFKRTKSLLIKIRFHDVFVRLCLAGVKMLLLRFYDDKLDV